VHILLTIKVQKYVVVVVVVVVVISQSKNLDSAADIRKVSADSGEEILKNLNSVRNMLKDLLPLNLIHP
jgi:hypothetical protein